MLDTKHDECTGCTACAYVCPQKCINIRQDANGFYHPRVNGELCINCAACNNVCHVNHKVLLKKDKEYYACWSKDTIQREKGSSGGIFGALAVEILSYGGIVYGVVFSEDYKYAYHTSTDEVEIEKLYKSKYVEARMNNVIEDVIKQAKTGRLVMFCGTPCEVMGIRSVIGHKYSNVLLVDFVCHGVPSEMSYQKYVSALEEQYQRKIKSVSFRSKSFGWKLYCVLVQFSENIKYLKLGIEDPYLKLFLSGKNLRDCCYTCHRVSESWADITLGDFWGIAKCNKIKDDDKGISSVFLNTQLGKQIFQNIVSKINVVSLSYEDIKESYEKKRPENPHLTIDEIDYKYTPEKNIIKIIKIYILKNSLTRSLIFKINTIRK